MSYSTDNIIIDYMKENNYKFLQTEKNCCDGREISALIDYLISKNCNNVFIGNFNMLTSNINGSTFSYLISTNLDNTVKQILITMENIEAEEQIYFNTI